jgi:general secretion pathway protein B
MSYILDALKKAESERQLGSAPDLLAQQPAVLAPPPPKPSFQARPWIGTGLAGLTIMLIALAWFKPWQPAPTVVASAAPPQQPASPPAEAPSAPASAAPPVAAQPSPVAEPPPPTKQAAEKPVEKKAPPTKQRVEKKLAQAAPAKPSPRKPAPAQDAAESSESRVVALHELPRAIQNELPALAINGYIYSGNKADRTVLVNKKLLREGDQVAPDLTLERLTPTGMVLNYKGYRYRASY